jgi:hypothetical protein
MLIMSLIASTFLLLAANVIVRRGRHPVTMIVSLSLAIAFGPIFLMFVLPTAAIQGLFTTLAVIIWRVSGRGPGRFVALSCAAAVVAYGLGGWMAWQSEREYGRLRRLHPYESMAERVPEPKRDDDAMQLTAVAAHRLDRIEARITHDDGRGWYRNAQLQTLHDNAVGLFINSPGFGVARMIVPSERGLTPRFGLNPAAGQPGPRLASPWSPGEHEPPPKTEQPFLAWLFEDSLNEFVFTSGWGFVKDRDHVAGFLSHRFTEVPRPSAGWRIDDDLTEKFTEIPEPTTHWRVQILDLVGLLMYDEPVVYVSDRLPAMDELRGAPTRPLDKFEKLGLVTLRKGEDLFTSRDGDGPRMLGAVRSTKQCIACHGGQRGDLLGAFSYTLKRNGK